MAEIVLALLVVGAVGCFLYVRHARVTKAPLIDLNLLKIDTFFATTMPHTKACGAVGGLKVTVPLRSEGPYAMSAFALESASQFFAPKGLAMAFMPNEPPPRPVRKGTTM